MRTTSREILEDALHQVCAGRERLELLVIAKRHIIIASAFNQSHHDSGVLSTDRYDGKMQHSALSEIPREIAAMVIGETFAGYCQLKPFKNTSPTEAGSVQLLGRR